MKHEPSTDSQGLVPVPEGIYGSPGDYGGEDCSLFYLPDEGGSDSKWTDKPGNRRPKPALQMRLMQMPAWPFGIPDESGL